MKLATFPFRPRMAPRMVAWNRTEFFRNRCLVHRFPKELLNMVKAVLFLFSNQSEGHTVSLRAGSSPNTVNIVFAFMRNVKINHHIDGIYINTPRQNISSHEYGYAPTGKLGEYILPVGL